ncbi:enoyl-CoA hydratase/isomerase family protein [Cupriavidus sp. 30B13]|uniref:enoyl-CoA hydratase/isomerase family protein n=1 Tax=Cupriavidus sp. 30B13 TaxID=3384241 RepID=UPI003B91FB5D
MDKPDPSVVRTEVRDGIVLLAIDNAPVNALSNGVRQTLFNSLGDAQANAGVHAIVIHGCRDRFSGGADIREFNGSRRRPFTSDVAALAETGAKPVVAAIAGFALGAGLELALGAHARIAAASARLALPEVKLGLLPGGGGTQRLPRLVGLGNALDLILSGRTLGVDEAHAMGLVDKIVDDGRLVEEAVAFARELAQGIRPLRRTGALVARLDVDAARSLRHARRRLTDSGEALPVHRRIIDAVRAAAELPLSEGLKLEHDAFMHCVETPEHRALAEAFFARRAAAQAGKLNRPADRAS